MFLYQIFVLGFLAVISCAYIPEQAKNEYSEIYSILEKDQGYEALRLRRSIPDRFKRNLIRSKRQSSSLQGALQNLQNTQQQQSQGQRRPGQNGQFGSGQGFSNGQGGFNNGGQGSGQNGGFSNGGVNSGDGTGSGGFNQGGFEGNQGQGGFGGNQGGNAGNQGQGGQPWTTVRNPLNVIINENTVPEADCIRKCLSVNNYNPVCGSDDITYTNRQKLVCAQQCGRQVNLVYNGSCVTTTTPASSSN